MPTMPVDRGFVVTSGFGPRWGTIHYGTDFGRNGGSGGYPIYAVKAGTATAAGPASGFGRWINIDHPASNGGGLTVYGHIIPEVRVGQVVSEGQRIGRIDPDSRTNGGVAPHLHLEWHRYVWSPPGPNRLDPMPLLAGARWPGDAAPVPPAPPVQEVTFALDISEWQNPISLRAAKADGIAGVIIRTNDGTHRDKVFRSHLDDARANGLPVSAYWFVRRPDEGTSIAAQADVVAAQLDGQGDIGVWLDVESPGGMDRATVYAARDALRARGIRVIGIYSTAGYWESIRGGEPPARDFGAIWVANFGPDRKGNFRSIYPGNGHAVWDYPLGDRKPDLWQFTQHGRIPSYGGSLDVNAFRGSPAQLKALFEGTTGEDWFDMATEADLRLIIREEVAAFCGPIGHDAKRIAVQMGLDADDAGFARVPGWVQGGHRSFYDLMSAVAEKVGVSRTKDTLPELPAGARNPKLRG
ncbi:GH25 family lysozyme [Dietzia cinnamea]|uniref:GH25 family lysozyme n=1 Tax=Dietzia cinnamea TaxID=321318 RepID=UPI0021A50AA5|nr:GH25 family lysozyme [Dietzia cinnamea]MCT2121728.1 peptidoglycan DD-metalloendopeptidase family protein [Dietzia cinnamea]